MSPSPDFPYGRIRRPTAPRRLNRARTYAWRVSPSAVSHLLAITAGTSITRGRGKTAENVAGRSYLAMYAVTTATNIADKHFGGERFQVFQNKSQFISLFELSVFACEMAFGARGVRQPQCSSLTCRETRR